MDRLRDIVLTDLRFQIAELGRDGGMMNSSVYDTAQVLRLAPQGDSQRWSALEWLLGQQRDDGGWGSPAAPRARDVPTLASVLAQLP
jgi:halimadienyl-diphosphate synthase